MSGNSVMCQGKMKFCKNVRAMSGNFTFQPDEAGMFDPDVSFLLNSFVSGKCQGIVREFWSVLHCMNPEVWNTYGMHSHCPWRGTIINNKNELLQ